MALGARIVSRCKIPQLVKQYIEKYDLQKNPKDRREYFCDAELQRVLQRKTFTLFSINKLIAPMVMRPTDCDDATRAEAEEHDARLLKQKVAEADANEDEDEEQPVRRKKRKVVRKSSTSSDCKTEQDRKCTTRG